MMNPPLKRPTDQTRERAIELRRNSTKPERLLWSVLRGKNLGRFKFRRQHAIEPYIVDFYCAAAELVIELDGESHEGRQEYDAERSEFLRDLGLRVVRFTNDDVLTNLEGVADAILAAAQRR
jgi:very-short-patch-repair endonuclease